MLDVIITDLREGSDNIVTSSKAPPPAPTPPLPSPHTAPPRQQYQNDVTCNNTKRKIKINLRLLTDLHFRYAPFPFVFPFFFPTFSVAPSIHFSTSHNTPPFNPPPLAIAANIVPASMGISGYVATTAFTFAPPDKSVAAEEGQPFVLCCDNTTPASLYTP